MSRTAPGIRTKLIGIFMLMIIIPLLALSWLAWNEIVRLTDAVEQKSSRMITKTHGVVKGISALAIQDSIHALDTKSREALERLTTNLANQIATFLYDRDGDILLASRLPADETHYRNFLKSRFRPVVLPHPWVMNAKGDKWIPCAATDIKREMIVDARISDNRRDFHYRPPGHGGIVENRPLYLEMTFVDLSGNEIVKVGTSTILSDSRNNVADPANTYCRAETYFQALKNLKPGQIHVSEVIGPYVKAHLQGTYSRVEADKKGIAFAPEKSAFAGQQNPVGIRFQGLVRWGTPVVRDGGIIGYVTLALDHTHIMEFTDHLVPTEERYAAITDASCGNYALLWDHKSRNISHPNDYYIAGYDPQTGKPCVPWLDEEMHAIWVQNGKSMEAFQKNAPAFKNQSLDKKPAPQLIEAGMLGLDCRYLNFAPQCTGWQTLTSKGGSGSFLVLWDGLWKLATAATIPYRTGIYGEHRQGFGFVTICANAGEFHQSAVETAKAIEKVEDGFSQKLEQEKKDHLDLIDTSFQNAFHRLLAVTVVMIVVVIAIAVFMAAFLAKRITAIIGGIRRFQQVDLNHRLDVESHDEMGQLAHAFNKMADSIQSHINDVEASKSELEELNAHLENEIVQRRQAEKELSENQNNLERMVRERTRKLEEEIVERRRVEVLQQESQSRLRLQNTTVLSLTSNKKLYEGDLEQSLVIITPMVAQTMKVDRCGVWLLNEKGTDLICKTMVANGIPCNPEPHTFKTKHYPRLVAALEANQSIAANDVLRDDRLAELSGSYFPSLEIRAALLARINDNGRLTGIISFSEKAEPRDWHLDEINFANFISDIIGMSIGAAKRRQAIKEKEQLSARLRRAEKMEAIGTTAGGVAHDLNNILSGIVSYPELLLLQLPENSPLRDPLLAIHDSGKRAATIVQDLLTLARRGVTVTEVVNLNHIVEDYLRSPEHLKLITYHPHVRLETKLAPDLMNVCGSPVHLTKTLMNLVSNAAEAIEEEGLVTISTRNCYIDKPIKGNDVINEGDYAALCVRDTGAGISQEDLNRIFEPFYTKKKMGRSGTGLGMAVVWGTVKDHQGYIDYDSRENEGTHFSLYFPATREQIEKSHTQAIETYKGNGENILVIDDIKNQREIASAILSTLGYRVRTASSGEEAVAYLSRQAVDLVILDMIMEPGMDGLDTYRQILNHRPRQKAIIASGYSETDRLREVQRLGASFYLKKPYSIENIGTAVRAVLEA